MMSRDFANKIPIVSLYHAFSLSSKAGCMAAERSSAAQPATVRNEPHAEGQLSVGLWRALVSYRSIRFTSYPEPAGQSESDESCAKD